MALSENEIKSSDTLKLLTQLVRVGFPVEYARIESWHIDPGGPGFSAMLALYYSGEVRQTDPLSCAHYGIGCNLTPEAMAFLTWADDRDTLYKAVEYIVHYQIFQQMLNKITNKGEAEAFITEKNQVLDELNDALGIDLSTLFTLGQHDAPGVNWEETQSNPPGGDASEG
jgi:hypothetical protein